MRFPWRHIITGLAGLIVAGTVAAAGVQAQSGTLRLSGERATDLRQRPHYSEPPIAELEPEERASAREGIDAMRTEGRIDVPDDAMPPPDRVVLDHVVPLDSLRKRLSFEPVIPSVAGYELLGAIEVPSGPFDGLPSPPAQLSSVQLVYQAGGGTGPLVIVSEEDLEAGQVWATIPAEALNADIEGHRSVQRTLRGQQSERVWNEVSFFDESSSLMYTVGGETELPTVRTVAQALAKA